MSQAPWTPPTEAPPPVAVSPYEPRAGWPWVLLCLFGYGSAALWLAPLPFSFFVSVGASPVLRGGLALLMLALYVAAAVKAGAWLRRRPAGTRAAAEVFALGVLWLWGLALNQALPGNCVNDGCGVDLQRPLQVPQVYLLSALHFAAAGAYHVSRKRPGALEPRAEAGLVGALLVGMVVHALLAVQFVKVLVYLPAFPLTWPVATPYLCLTLLGREVALRLRERGLEAARSAPLEPSEGLQVAYRPVPQASPPGGPSWGLLGRGGAVAAALLGGWTLLLGALSHRASGALGVVTQTCTHPLSRLPLEVVHRDCHYLCTVAARGHPWLVRPERLGRRGGHTIVVNRQLAVANAFEDLLHERWPRFGRLARRTYDALGLPVSRWIRWTFLADLVYLAMKPAEWLFLAALLALDPGDPEARIQRMYR
ncbi:MAG: hypothetical protein HY909_23735 [Deltaproteobacteria bacterium]|nr:hypothetical protein [Deltaproteobacteria bacterium]